MPSKENSPAAYTKFLLETGVPSDVDITVEVYGQFGSEQIGSAETSLGNSIELSGQDKINVKFINQTFKVDLPVGGSTIPEPILIIGKIGPPQNVAPVRWLGVKKGLPDGDLEDRDQVTVEDLTQDFSSVPGVATIIRRGGTTNTSIDYQFTLQSNGSDVSYSDAQENQSGFITTSQPDRLKTQGTLSFTNTNKNGTWSGVDGVKVEVQDPSGTNYKEIDTVSFSSIDVPDGATLEVTEIIHNLTY